MITLVSSLGISPMVVTETIDELGKRGVNIDRVVVLVTQDSRVETSYYVLALDLKWNYGSVELERIVLPFNDIRNQEDHDRFVKIAKDVINKEIKNNNRVIVSVAGGRKTMSVGLYKAAVESGIDEIYHVIAEEIPGTSDMLKDLIKYDLKAIYEGKIEAPESLKNLISWKMHRTDLKLSLIRV